MTSNKDNNTQDQQPWSYSSTATPEDLDKYRNRSKKWALTDSTDSTTQTSTTTTTTLPKAKPHRCNGHLEDLIIGITEKPFDVVQPFQVLWKCIWSEKGQEPRRLNKVSKWQS